MHEIPLLINVAVTLVVAFIRGVLARHIGPPTIVGYWVAAIITGPFTYGFVRDTEMTSQLADLNEVGYQSIRMTINTKGF